jgi:cytochrome c oxidase assembly factor CtaG
MLWAVTRMPVAWITYAVVLWGWHVPAAYDSALADGLLHDVEHVAFFVSAVTFWWPVLDPAPHVGRSAHAGLRVIYLVTGALQSAALGLLLAGSPVPLYTSYIAREAEGLSALDDQALGGVVMWGVGGAVDMLVLLVLVYRFLAANAHDHRAAAPSRP